MKFSLKNLKLKTKKSYKKGSQTVDPDFYWNIVLVIFAVMVVTAFVYGFLVFRKVNKEFISSEIEINLQAGVLKKTKLDGALDYFEIRASKSAEITNSPSPIIDPSL